MNPNPKNKYKPYRPVNLINRSWPNRVQQNAPQWCSVDLRDGNQALATPMSISQKLEMFLALVKIGFKEIEVGFPSASETEFAFNRCLIEGGHIPDDVSIQVLVPAREALIERTFQSLLGAKRVIIHMYNSTSPAQRRVVFGKSKQEIIDLAIQGARMIYERLPLLKGTEVTLQYSPESFSLTEVEYAKEVAEAVMSVWCPTPARKMILNLPETVEVAPPNVYADQIEWMCQHIQNRTALRVSLHTHNDRGTGVAAAELGLLAGAERVEGTLFGNGERTGNLDIVTMALNLYMQGIDPQLDFSELPDVVSMYQRCTGMQVPPRHPYAGELVFTAFSGSHQDAIRKGLVEWKHNQGQGTWDVPYLPIDPQDIGRDYQVIRINSQSGKGGVSYLLENGCGIEVPKSLQPELGALVTAKVDQLGTEIDALAIRALFWREYVNVQYPLALQDTVTTAFKGGVRCQLTISEGGPARTLQGEGNGPLAAFVRGLTRICGELEVVSYHEHAIGQGTAAEAIAYVELKVQNNTISWGAGVSSSIEKASFYAVISALNRARPALLKSLQPVR